MSGNDADAYALSRDTAESERLSDQHRLTVDNIGYLINPVILEKLPSGAYVADVATGTGVWALNVARNLPDAVRITGYDISASQFPSNLPDNVVLKIADAKKPFPDSEHGKYDVVHIRGLLVAMQLPDWAIVMHNIVQLLKPGGAVQWTEGNLSHVTCMRGNGEFCHYKALPMLVTAFQEAMGDILGHGWHMLPQVADKQGLADVILDITSSDRLPETRKASTRMFATALLGWAQKAGKWSSEQIETLKVDIEEDIEHGAYVRGDTLTIIGWKPTDAT